MTGGLQTTGQRLTDRHAAPTAAETDTQNTYSQQEHSMSSTESMATVQRPPWATHSRLDEESPATIYHAFGYEVEDRWVERGADTVSVEVYVSDDVVLTDDNAVEYRRHEPMVHMTGGILTLAAAAELADALVTALVITVADEETAALAERVLLAVEDLKAEVRERQAPVAGRTVQPDTFRALSRCDHGVGVHETCQECRTARQAARKAGA